MAFSYLYDNYYKALFGVIRKIVNNHEIAEDTLQQVFVKIWMSFDSYDESKGKLFTWMLSIARNAALDYLRSKQAGKDSLKLNSDNIEVEINKEISFENNFDHLGLPNLLKELNVEQNELIKMSYYLGYTHEEISKKMNIPLGSVKTKIRNSIIKLKELKVK